MNGKLINQVLSTEIPKAPDFLPHLAELERSAIRFRYDFGLDELPLAPGILVIRGARQYGKSTWLEQELWGTIKAFGPGTAFYLNGDDIVDAADLGRSIEELLPLYSSSARVRRLFIDEITAVRDWQKALKRLADAGALRDVLVVTTGSRAADLRRGIERLPGRKGKLSRSTYLFAPISFSEFSRVAGPLLQNDTLDAYMMTGGSPVACSEIVRGRVPEYAVEIVKDWVLGECAWSGRSRSSLVAVMEHLLRRGGTPVSQAGLARDTGLANNTVAEGYIDMLCDLMCITPTYAWDASRKIKVRRRPRKLPFCNTMVALAWHPAHLRTVQEFKQAPSEVRAMWREWTVAQELWRRAAIAGRDPAEELQYWQGNGHEVDFVESPGDFIEVKSGKTSPVEFAWFSRTFPNRVLTVIGQNAYESAAVRGITLEDFLRSSRNLPSAQAPRDRP